MKAFVLAAALRMIGPTMQKADAQLEQPHAEPGPARPRRMAPRRPIADEEGIGQTVAAECALQRFPHRTALSVGAGAKTGRVARMIIQARQWMPAATIEQIDTA